MAANWKMRSNRRQENKVLWSSLSVFHAQHHRSQVCISSLQNHLWSPYSGLIMLFNLCANFAPLFLPHFRASLLISFVLPACNFAIGKVILAFGLTDVLKRSHGKCVLTVWMIAAECIAHGPLHPAQSMAVSITDKHKQKKKNKKHLISKTWRNLLLISKTNQCERKH